MQGATLLELNEVTIPYRQGEPVKICELGDVHWITKLTDGDAYNRALKWIVKNEAYVVGGGDMIDAINYKDKRFDPSILTDEGLSNLKNLPQWQADSLIETLRCIPQDKWIGFHSGNHEEKIEDFDVTQYICDELGIMNYKRFAWTRIRFVRESGNSKHTEIFKLLSFHPEGNSSTDPGKLKKIIDVYNNYRADLYMMAHVHSIQIARKSSATIPTKGKLQMITPSHGLLIGGTFQKTMEEGVSSYSEKRVYPPSKTGIATFEIYPEERKIHIMC